MITGENYLLGKKKVGDFMKDKSCGLYVHTYKCGEADCDGCLYSYKTKGNNLIVENAIEITQIYIRMVEEKRIVPPVDSRDANEEIKYISRAFEDKFPYEDSWDGEMDYIEEITKFTETKLKEAFGCDK